MKNTNFQARAFAVILFSRSFENIYRHSSVFSQHPMGFMTKFSLILVTLSALILTGVSVEPLESDLRIYGGTSAGIIGQCKQLPTMARAQLLLDQQVLAVPTAR